MTLTGIRGALISALERRLSVIGRKVMKTWGAIGTRWAGVIVEGGPPGWYAVAVLSTHENESPIVFIREEDVELYLYGTETDKSD